MSLDPKSFHRGYVHGCVEERAQHRAAAFGAIRRAAEIMRWHEANAKRLAPYRPDGLNEYEAKAIRRAIRATIGSPKA